MISEYHHRRSNGTEHRDIDEALYDVQRYHEWSRYFDQIARYIEVFGVEQVLVLIAERLFNDDEAEASRLARFLGLDPHPFLGKSFTHANPTSNRAVRPTTIRRLAATPVYRAVSKRTSEPVRQIWRRATSTKYTLQERNRRPSDATIEWVIATLRNDTDQLRRLMGDPINEWADSPCKI
jgi:hypothetical protein